MSRQPAVQRPPRKFVSTLSTFRSETTMNKSLIAFTMCAILILSACKNPSSQGGGTKTSGQPDVKNGPEAREWLTGNGNESALASNRFGLTAEALEFVEQLYSAGAERVIVPRTCLMDEPDRIKLEGGPYADCLSVFLSKDPDKRSAVLQLCRREIEREGFDPDEGTVDDFVFLWWD